MAGYRVCQAATGAEARALMDQVQPDLVMLDLILPDVDGLVLCTILKAQRPVPIVVCSASGRRRDAVLALKLGADDYIAKPFNAEDVLARIEAILRRTAAPVAPPAAPEPASKELRVGALTVDGARRRVLLGGEPIQLTPTEYRLLSALAARPDQILSRDELGQMVWGYADAAAGRTIDVHVRRLRVKLSQDRCPAPTIVSVRGYGYRLEPDGSANAA
jgi:two-component system response regulator MtrA